MKGLLVACCLAVLLWGCASEEKKLLRVAATATPHAEILEKTRPFLLKRGVILDLLVLDDYNSANRALVEGEVEANFFQHLPFLEAECALFGYAIEPLVAVHIEPLGGYSLRYQTFKEIKKGATIALPSDPVNQARALLLLERLGALTLSRHDRGAALWHIKENPNLWQFQEVDAALLLRILEDVDLALIPTNFVLQSNRAALFYESRESPFINIVAIRSEDRESADLLLLKEALEDPAIAQFIQTRYEGLILLAEPL